MAAWTTAWDRASITVDGNHHLMKLTAASMYYMMTSLPESKPRSDDAGVGLGVGDHGLVNGVNGSNSNGHVTWLQEKWLFPVALLFFPEKARTMLQYRSERVDEAKALATRFVSGP